MTPLLTKDEAAKLLQVAPSTLQRWCAEGRVPVLRFNHKIVRFRLSDLDRGSEAPARDALIDGFEVAYILRLSRQVVDTWRTGSRCHLHRSRPPFVGELCNERALDAWINEHKGNSRLLAEPSAGSARTNTRIYRGVQPGFKNRPSSPSRTHEAY